MMKKTLFLLNALLLTGIGASAESITLGNSSWYAGSGTGTAASNYGDYAKENYNGSGHSAGVLLHQTATGLTANTAYVIEFFAAVNQANGISGTSGEGYAQVYAGSTTKDITVETKSASDFPNGSETAILGWGDAYHHILVATADNDGNIDFGVQNVTAAGNWAIAYAVSATPLSEYTGIATAHKCTATIDDWTITGNSNGDFHYNDWSVEADASGMVVPFLEYWVGSWEGNLSAATISHNTITGLATGYYEVSMDIRIFSEAGNTIGTGTTFTANSASEDLVTYGTGGTYGTETEVYGTYTLICSVEEGGGLDISITIPSGVAYNWISFKNLDVVYMGTSLDYSIGTPTCSASCVKPGSTVSITFPDCITPTSGETPTLDSNKYITVGDETVTGTLSYSGTTATVTFTMPSTIGYGETVTVSVPEGLLSWGSTEVSSTSATFYLTTPPFADQEGVYILSVYDNEFLSRGYNYGTAADVDRYGVPVNIVFGDDGKATVEYMDSKLYLYGPNWAWSDAAEANASHYTLVAVDGQEGVYQFLGGTGADDDYPMYVYDVTKASGATDSEDTYRVANNGIMGDNYTNDEQTYWKILTREERDAMKDAWVLGEYQEIAASFGATISSKDDFEAFLDAIGTSSDVTEKVTDATLKSVTLKTNETTAGWCIKYPTENTADPTHEGFASDTNCTEMFQSDGDLYQNVENLEPGLYKVTLKGFIRHGWYDTCVTYEDYDLSYAYLRANDYEINLVPWVKDATLDSTQADYSTSTPNNMATAGTAFDSTDPSKYDNTLYTIVGEDGKLSIEIACPGWLSSEWTCIRDLTLTYYGNPDVVTWTLGAEYGTLILPFDYDLSSTSLTAYTGAISGDVMELTAVNDNAITAYTPYIIGGTGEAQTTYYFSGTSGTEPSSLADESGLTGVLVDTYAPANSYVLQKQEDTPAFYLVENADEILVAAYHCYLSSTSNAKSITFAFGDDVATRIDAVETEETSNDEIYDLSGRRVAKAQKGVYIVNGKKMVIK